MAELVADYRPEAPARVGRRTGSTATPATGSTPSSARSTAPDGDPEFIQARHEEMAAFMACGHAKFAGPDRSASAWRRPAPAPSTS